MAFGLRQVRQGGRSFAKSVYDDAGRRWPIIPLVGLWVVGVYRVARNVAGSPSTYLATLLSIAIVAVAVWGTVAWVRAEPLEGARGKRKSLPKRHRPS